MTEQRFTVAQMHQWLKSTIDQGHRLTFDSSAQLFVSSNASAVFELALPLICPPIGGEDANDAVAQLQAQPLTAIILLIQAGYAALGYCEGDTLVRHKMVKKYMVRQSQGKAQLTYKKSKGKSRLGSRIRLHNSVVFFEEINQTLHSWNVMPKCNRILLSLPVNLTHLLYSANIPPPFTKKDARIKKIPLNVKTPSYRELCHIHWEVTHGRLVQKEK
ncbi:MAG: hypothetical protein JXX14_25345 [Deltaproteobacteria bacterium]|nr:hypothetical protein [Deltaproteobacteria bacterium]